MTYPYVFHFSHSGRVTLKFTYTEDPVDPLPLTLIGYNLTCSKPNDLTLAYKDNVASECTRVTECGLVSEAVVDNRDNCHFECRCFDFEPCEIYISVTQHQGRVLCDIVRTVVKNK